MNSQLRLTFASRDEAIQYAERNGIAYQVSAPQERTRVAMAYSDNFRRDRNQPWTH